MARTLAGYLEKAAALEAAVHALFPSHSPQRREFHNILARYRETWRSLAENRNLILPALAFIGERRSGKTTLIRQLGPTLSTTTASRIQWIGPEKPGALHPAVEEYHRVEAEDMADLGRPCLLIDTPPIESISAASGNADAFHHLFTATRFKIVCLDWEKIESSPWQQTLANYRGSIVLPVIRLDPESTRHHPGNLPDLLETWSRDHLPDLQAHLPGIQIDEPLFLPHLDAMGDRQAALATVRSALTQRLRAFLDAHQATSPDRLAELESSWAAFIDAIRPLARTFDTPLLTERYRELESAIDAIPRHIIDHLLADQRRIRALIRMDLRSTLMERVPAAAFPFRTLTGLLCLTTGLWDRLILGATGSIPSALLTVAGAARSRTEEIQAEKSHRTSMDASLRTLVRNHLAAPWQGFTAALDKADAPATTEAPKTHEATESISEFHIHGTEELAALWKTAQADAIRPAATRGATLITLASLLGTLLFWLLFAGPLAQTYGQYLPASLRSLTGAWTPENLATYPSPGAGFWFTAVILSLIPSFLIALILVALRLGGRRISQCEKRLHTRMHDHHRQGRLHLRIQPTDPRADAYRQLSRLNRGETSQPARELRS